MIPFHKICTIVFVLLTIPSLNAQTQLRPEPIVQFGHPGYVIQDIVLSPDNEVMATTDGEFLKLWDISSQLELRSFRGDNGYLNFLGFSNNGDTICYASKRYLYVRSVLTGELFDRIDLLKNEENIKKTKKPLLEGALAFGLGITIPDSIASFEQLAMAKLESYKDIGNLLGDIGGRYTRRYKKIRDGINIIKDLKEGQEEKQDSYLYIQMSPYNDHIAGVKANDTLTIFRMEKDQEQIIQKISLEKTSSRSGKKKLNLRKVFSGQSMLIGLGGSGNDVKNMIFSPDQQSILVDTTLYNINTGEKVFQFSPYEYGMEINAIYFQPNSSQLIFCGQLLEEPQEREEEQKEKREESNDPLAEINQILSDGYNINLGLGNTVIFADPSTGEIISDGNLAGVNHSFFLDNHPYLATGHIDKAFYLWDWEQKRKHLEIRLRRANDHEAIDIFGITKMVQTNDQKYLIVACAGSVPEDRLTIWDIRSGRQVGSFGAAIPPISLDVKPSDSDSIIVQEYKEYLFPKEQLSYKDYGAYRLLSLRNGQAPALYPKFDSILFSPKLDYYLVQTNVDEPIRVYGSEYNELEAALTDSKQAFELVAFSNKAKWVAAYRQKNIYLWEAQNGELKHIIPQGEKKMLSLVFSPQDDYLICTYKPMRMRFYDLDKPSKAHYEKKPNAAEVFNYRAKKLSNGIKKLKPKKDGIGKLDFDIGGEQNVRPNIEELNQMEETNTKIYNATKLFDLLFFKSYYDIEVSSDGKYAAAWRDDLSSVQFIDLANKKKMALVNEDKVLVAKTVASILKSPYAVVGETLTQSFLRDRMTLKTHSSISPNWDYIAIATKPNNNQDQQIRIVPIRNKQGLIDKYSEKEIPGTYHLSGSEAFGEGIVYSPDGQLIAASSNGLNSIRIWNAESGSILTTFERHSGKLAFTSNSQALISSGWDRQVKVWDIDSQKELYSFIAIKGENDYVNLLPSGYYSSSRKNSGAIAFAYGKEAYPFDQFDLQFNRPDSLLIAFQQSIMTGLDENPNEVLISAYHRSYQKRLEKMNLKEKDFNHYVSLPQLVVKEHPFSSNDRQVTIQLEAKDERYALNNLFASINGVPILTGGKRNIYNSGSKHYRGRINFELSDGDNLLKLYVVNKAGMASLKYSTTIAYTGPPTKSTLYILTLGTSEFADSSHNLNFATKDLQDFRNLYQQRSQSFDQVITKFLEGTNFTLDKFHLLKEEMRKTKVNDEVVCFISTHGLLGTQLDYYLATYDVNFATPEERGLAFTELEDFLQKIGARSKLVLLDACHSGELDSKDMKKIREESEQLSELTFTQKGIQSIGWEQLPGQQSFDLMKELFVDLRVGTGATIIASAGGQQYAYEGAEWENSAFANCLFRAMREGVADTNNDDVTTVDEIQTYLSYAVPKLTKNQQKPISRIDNIFNNFVFW